MLQSLPSCLSFSENESYQKREEIRVEIFWWLPALIVWLPSLILVVDILSEILVICSVVTGVL